VVATALAQAALAAREATSQLLMQPATCDLPKGRTADVVEQAVLHLRQAEDTLVAEARVLMRTPEAE
jgi:hypothetical protein